MSKNFNISRILITINVLAFIFEVLYLGPLAFWGQVDPQALLNIGAMSGEFVQAGGAWSMFTAIFIHIGFIHLLGNMIGIYFYGDAVEYASNKWMVLTSFIVGGLVGNLVSLMFFPINVVSAGASGGVFSLLGTLLALLINNRKFAANRRVVIEQALLILVFNLGIGLQSATINNFAHIGGLAAGVLVGIIYRIFTKNKY